MSYRKIRCVICIVWMLIEVKKNSMETEMRKLFLLIAKAFFVFEKCQRILQKHFSVLRNVSAFCKAIFQFWEMPAHFAKAFFFFEKCQHYLWAHTKNRWIYFSINKKDTLLNFCKKIPALPYRTMADGWTRFLSSRKGAKRRKGFGVFDDCLPDGWGLLILDRYLQKLGINPRTLSLLDRLALDCTSSKQHTKKVSLTLWE